MKKTNDLVNNPAHYQGKTLESIEVIEAYRLGFHLGNVFKYLIRHERKNGVADLRKALWYLGRFIGDIKVRQSQNMAWGAGEIGSGRTALGIAADFGFTATDKPLIASCIDLLLNMPFSDDPRTTAKVIVRGLEQYLERC